MVYALDDVMHVPQLVKEWIGLLVGCLSIAVPTFFYLEYVVAEVRDMRNEVVISRLVETERDGSWQKLDEQNLGIQRNLVSSVKDLGTEIAKQSISIDHVPPFRCRRPGPAWVSVRSNLGES